MASRNFIVIGYKLSVCYQYSHKYVKVGKIGEYHGISG